MADTPRIRVTLPSHTRYLDAVRTLVKESCDLAGFEDAVGKNIVLAVNEAWANVIRHCYNCAEDQRIDLAVSFGDDEFEIRIDDYGRFVDPKRIRSRPLDEVRPGGLGVHFMTSVMDRVEYTRNDWGGTTLILAKRRRGDDPPPEKDKE